MTPDIRRPEAIDAAWLTSALQANGIDAVVSGFETRAVGTGQIGDSVRFQLAYARGGEAAPASLVGKFPSTDPNSFEVGAAGGNYLREVRFYQRLAARALIATPKWYVCDIDEASGEFVLLMEDLAPAEQGDQLKGVTLDQARLVVDEAAKLHASHFGDDSLEDEPWVFGSRNAATQLTPPDVFLQVWRTYEERYGERLTPRAIEAGRRLGERIETFRALPQGMRCLMHYDYRPDNMMFATAAGGRPVTILDWQSVGLGAGAMDLGYFLAGAIAPEARRAHEPELLARYRDGLARLGVTGVSEEALRRDYAAGGLRLLLTAFLSAIRVKRTDRGDAMFAQMVNSAGEHAYDNGALALLD
jgi:hypothetical protein